MLDIRGVTALIQVFDMAKSLDFYCGLLEFEVANSAGPPGDTGWAFLRRGGVELMLNTAYETPDRPPAPDPAREIAHSDTILYFGCPDVDAAYAHLRAHGIDVREPVVAPYGMKQLNVRDPDGYALCFQWPVET